MSLNLGSLVGYLDLDAEGFEGGLEGALGKLEDFASKGAVKAAAGGVAIAGAVGAAVAGAMDVEAANDKLAAQLGLSAGESERIGGVAGALYAGAYGDSLEEVNGAVGAVMSSIAGMRDASSADLQAASTDALNFAAAFDTDVTEAVNSAGLLIQNGLASDATNAFDLMTASYQRVPAAMREELPAILDEYGTNFRALGFNGEQAFALLTDAAQKGPFVLDKMGDALKELTINGIDLGKNGALYEQLGLDAEGMANAIASGGPPAQQAMQQIAAALSGMEDPAARANAAVQLFGTPLEDLSLDQVPTFLDSIAGVGPGMTDAAGSIAGLGTTLNDNASSNLESFKRQAEQAFVNVLGGRVLPIVDSVASFLATSFGPALSAVKDIIANDVVPALQTAATWINNNKTPILIVAGIIAAIFIPHLVALGVAATVNAAKVVAGWVVQQAGAVAAAAVHSVQVIRMIAGWVLLGVQSMIQAARVAAAWLIAMGPIAIVIAAVVALVALIIANFDTIKNAIGAAWDWVKDASKAAWDWIVGIVTGAWDWLSSTVSTGVSNVVGFVTGLPGRVVAGLSALGSMIAAVASGAWQWFYDTVVVKVGDLIGFVAGLPGRVAGAIGNLGSLLWQKGVDLIQGLINGIGSAAGYVGNIARNIANGVIGTINGVIDGINNLLEFTIPVPGLPDIHVNPPNIGHIPRLADGGIIPATPGGVLAFVGEGPEDELVIPRSKAQDILGRGGGPAATLHIEHYHEAEGASARGTAEELAFLARTRPGG